MYLRNSWYVAALSSEIGAKLTAFRILGENIVIYRTERGEPVALEDSCPHRRLPLSKGRLLNDNIECGYHGFAIRSFRSMRCRPDARSNPTRSNCPKLSSSRSVGFGLDLDG